MAIGIASLFGLLLPENFRRPYLSTDLREFWRRWHISLSNFIRDYLYIPLGGSRAGPVRYVFATMAAMAICGLWDGAGWPMWCGACGTEPGSSSAAPGRSASTRCPSRPDGRSRSYSSWRGGFSSVLPTSVPPRRSSSLWLVAQGSPGAVKGPALPQYSAI